MHDNNQRTKKQVENIGKGYLENVLKHPWRRWKIWKTQKTHWDFAQENATHGHA